MRGQQRSRDVSVLTLLLTAALLASVAALAYLAPPHVRDFLIRAVAVTLLLFILVLIVRYFVLLWLGYLHHVESGFSDDNDFAVFQPPVTIIVPAFNEGVTIESAIRSLLRQNYPQFEILIVDDGSTDDTRDRAVAFEGRWGASTVRVISKSNSGKAGALNMGIALAHYPFVMCVDGDSRLDEDTLRYSARHMSDPDVAAVAGSRSSSG